MTETKIPNHRWATKYPDLGTEPLSTEPYISEDFYQRERELFAKSWLNVGHVDDVGNPGDYMVREIVICNVSLLVTRDMEGEIHCFHNVCSHRGNKLVWDPDGSCRGHISCRFHGWTFDLKGNLASITDEANFFGPDKNQLGLAPVASAVWNGFIFVNLQPEPSETIEEYLGSLYQDMPEIPSELRLTFRYDVSERTNWKVALDAQNEAYHAPMLGPVHGSFGDAFTTTDDGYIRLANVELIGKHVFWSVDADPEYEPPGVQAVLDSELPPMRFELPSTSAFDFYILFPNFVFGFVPGFRGLMFTYNFWPLAIDDTLWEIRFFFPKATTATEMLTQNYLKAKFRDTLAEDIAGHERTYQGLASRAKPHIILQDEETQIRGFYKTLLDRVNELVPAEAPR